MNKRSYKAAIQTVRDLQYAVTFLQHATHAAGKISPKYHDNRSLMEIEEIQDRLKEIQHDYTRILIRIEDETNGTGKEPA